MQRIDENTYIDDTLVTCAEYQLFIDEMREQGKYYQPDHWTSYQFPEGQARKPILGVRHSDTIVFCEWLTNRERNEWKYRLPDQREAEHFPINPLVQSPLGYWIIGADDQTRLAWIGSIPNNPRGIGTNSRIGNFAFIFGISIDNNRGLDLDLDFARAFALALAHAYDRDIINVLKHEIDSIRNLGNDRTRALEKALGIAKMIDQTPKFGTFADVYTLQERILGRSPAFEGIRLVKERIR